ncbi:MAG: hypothetical protein FJ139_06120 [Deltaproteobacteria bacterium]|nr:hypothetical protein [Deltaproteobacteria bacterium]
MDKKFLEFWGNYLLNAARGQEHLDNMNRLIREGFKDFEQQMSLFRKCYGLDRESESLPHYMEMWSKAVSDFQNSYKEFLGLMGWVSKEEYLDLAEKYEALKEKSASQEETIRHLKIKTAASDVDQGEAVKGFEVLMKKQSEQFQELMKSFGQLYEEPTKKKKAKK